MVAAAADIITESRGGKLVDRLIKERKESLCAGLVAGPGWVLCCHTTPLLPLTLSPLAVRRVSAL